MCLSAQFELQDYVITRSLKDVTTLYDIFAATTVAGNYKFSFILFLVIIASNLPERPDKKGKDWRQQCESFLMYVAQSQELRNIPEFMEFIKPGDMTGNTLIKAYMYFAMCVINFCRDELIYMYIHMQKWKDFYF